MSGRSPVMNRHVLRSEPLLNLSLRILSTPDTYGHANQRNRDWPRPLPSQRFSLPVCGNRCV